MTLVPSLEILQSQAQKMVDSAITGMLTFTDAIDGDSVPTDYTITSESSNGTASIDATTGAWSYAPNANFNGSDSFAVTGH